MSIRDKYNKQNAAIPPKTAASSLLELDTEIQKSVSTDKQKDGNTEIHPKKATFNLDPQIHAQLKVRAALEGRNMADIVTDALKAYFEKNK